LLACFASRRSRASLSCRTSHVPIDRSIVIRPIRAAYREVHLHIYIVEAHRLDVIRLCHLHRGIEGVNPYSFVRVVVSDLCPPCTRNFDRSDHLLQ
jgi:hypothetical protein